MESVVHYESEDAVAVVTMHRPRVMNAIDLALRTQLQEALVRADSDPGVGVVVLTGAGGNFCAGRDLKAALRGEPAFASRDAQLAWFNRTSIVKPLIAAVEGYCLAGGFELALSCDLIVAGSGAQFGLPEVVHGQVAIGGGLFRLPQRMPYHAAMRLALTGERVSAEQMQSWGVVGRVCEPGGAVAGARELARRIMSNAPAAVRASKAIVRRTHDFVTEANAWEAQLPFAQQAQDSGESRRGLEAFAARSGKDAS
ncbi:enoyl-CoA hydratase-related protein [Dactylosporangium sp. CA-092794]|uniref:enoyl-CoA hydratase-related protein n=1 Tax=Dactylosporangium sp. CA-092794 TaxID=3239929 RepID=UPI003D92FD6D